MSCRGETTPLSQPPLSSARPHADAREVVAEEAMGSRETPSQRDPKVSSEFSQDLHLVNASLKKVSLNPCSGAQDLSLLKCSTKEASLDPLSSASKKQSLTSQTARTILSLEQQIAEGKQAL